MDNIKNLLNSGYSVEEICQKTNLSMQEIFTEVNKLKESGIYYYPKYGNNGEIFYTKNKVNEDDELKFNPVDNKFSFVGIADLHVGSRYDDLKRLDILQDYIGTNDIHFIINTGDLIDGRSNENSSRLKRLFRLEDQAFELLRKYPQLINLVTICVLGNHDLEAKSYDGFSFNEILRSSRHDFKVYSSGCGEIKVGNKTLFICHDINDRRIKDRIKDDENMIVFSSHSHKSKENIYFNGKDMCLRYQLPSLSKIPECENVASGFKRFDLYFDEYGFATGIHSIYYIFDNNNNLINVNEDHVNLNIGGNTRKRK